MLNRGFKEFLIIILLFKYKIIFFLRWIGINYLKNFVILIWFRVGIFLKIFEFMGIFFIL